MIFSRSAAALAAGTMLVGSQLLTSQAYAQSRAIEISPAAIDTAHNWVTDFGKRAGAPDSRVHIFPTTVSRHTLPKSILNRTNFHDFDLSKVKLSDLTTAEPETQVKSAAFPAAGSWSPADLSKTLSGATTIATAAQHPIYVNCSGSDKCWVTTAGDIGKFFTALNASTMVTIANQYVGSTAAHRYPVGSHFAVTKTFKKSPWGKQTMLDSDAQAIAAAASASGGTGYNHMYHIFVPSNVDACFDSSYSVCYSPDHGSSFAFCGYHSSFTDKNGHKVVYSVEPYDHVSTSVGGCMKTGQSVTDAQVSVLSHEFFEAVTDPDPNFAWYNTTLGEIGDECAWHLYAVNLSGTTYNIQLEYSNKSHACKAVP